MHQNIKLLIIAIFAEKKKYTPVRGQGNCAGLEKSEPRRERLWLKYNEQRPCLPREGGEPFKVWQLASLYTKPGVLDHFLAKLCMVPAFAGTTFNQYVFYHSLVRERMVRLALFFVSYANLTIRSLTIAARMFLSRVIAYTID